jgi:uroporphyrinogen decarboxylase
MSVHLTDRHLRLARQFVQKAHAAGGLAPLDLDKFWADDAVAQRDAWVPSCPQIPLGVWMGPECIFDELGVPEDWHRLRHDEDYRVPLARRYNDKAQQIVGRRLLNETRIDPRQCWPATRTLADVFEARNLWHAQSYWLQSSAATEDELQALLDRVEARLEKLRAFLLPPEWEDNKARLLAAGVPFPFYRSQRGPITFAMSVYGVENLIFLIADRPALAARFRDLIIRAMLGIAQVLDDESGQPPERIPHGWYWLDDNCALLDTAMYGFFGYPILKAVFDRYSPNPGDQRGQHSDSDMAQHLPALGRLGLTTVNFGPSLTVAEIRAHLPKAAIYGQLAPFTFSRNEEVNIVAEFIRDCEMAREKSGLLFATAGSVNAGSRLSGLRLIMAAIQEFGRYK